MTVLVTGGAGFIGSHLTERLLAAGHRVRVLDNLSTGKRVNLPTHAAFEFIEGDIRDADRVRAAVTGCEAIVHLAAVASVQASVDDPIGTHGSNLIGTLNLLEAARHAGIRRFLYASSAAVYGDTTALPVNEDTVLKPLSPYAADKLAGEHYLFFYGQKYGVVGTAFRFFNIYGPRQDPSSPYSGVISIFVDRARANQPVTVFGDGRQTRDFVYVADLVDVLFSALGNDRAGGQVMNVGRGVEVSLVEMLQELEFLFGRPIERRLQPPRIGDIRKSCADISRLKKLLSRAPDTTIRAGLSRLVQSLAS
ncbi:MAG: NAD-dependent epimerase/dehydratase family protein [Gammaproteobacteria bacterium]|nr:NAD-dependent epimerase/dehydratase family protein [Gammaproteobacteria bacterium]